MPTGTVVSHEPRIGWRAVAGLGFRVLVRGKTELLELVGNIVLLGPAEAGPGQVVVGESEGLRAVENEQGADRTADGHGHAAQETPGAAQSLVDRMVFLVRIQPDAGQADPLEQDEGVGLIRRDVGQADFGQCVEGLGPFLGQDRRLMRIDASAWERARSRSRPTISAMPRPLRLKLSTNSMSAAAAVWSMSVTRSVTCR